MPVRCDGNLCAVTGEEASQREKQLESKRDLFTELVQNQKQMDEQQASYLKQEQLYQSDEQACRTAELHWMRGQAGILARDLCENTPCPVCGSLEHPHPGADTGAGTE